MTPPNRAKTRPRLPLPLPAPTKVPTIPTGTVPPPAPRPDPWGNSEYLTGPAPSITTLQRGNIPAPQGPNRTFRPTSKPKEAREDSIESFSSRLTRTLKPLYARVLESHPDFQFSSKLFVRINLDTGEIASVTFSEVKAPGISEVPLQGFLQGVADQLRAKFRFRKGALQSGVDFIPVRIRFVAS